MAMRDNEPWNPDQEQELLRLVHDDVYRIENIGDFTTKWPPIAHYLGRTVKSVKRKYDKLFKQQRNYQQEQNMGHFDAQGSIPEGMQQFYPADMMMMGGMAQAYGAVEITPDMAAIMQQGGYAAPYGSSVYPSEMQAAMYPPHYGTVTHRGNNNSNSIVKPPKNDKSFWKDSELAELIKLGRDEEYREHVTGEKSLDWQAIADYFGRGKRSVQRKFENLKDSKLASDGTLVLPRNLGKKWSKAEVDELMKIADPDDSSYRFELFGNDKIDWRVLADYFGRSYEAVAYKYSYEKNSDESLNDPSRQKKHAKAKHETSYKDMAIKALQHLGGEGTSGQMCDFISQDELFAPQLDPSIVSGKKTLQRWKHGVRSALNAFEIFEKSDRTYKGEAVWILNLPNNYVQENKSGMTKYKQRTNTRKQLASAKRKKKKAEENKSGEDFAREVLTQMAQNKTIEKKKKKARDSENGEQTRKNEESLPPEQQRIDNDMAQAPVNLQQILDSSATAEQLSMLPPEHLAMLQHQIDQGNFAMNMAAYMSPGEGNQGGMMDPHHQGFHEQHQHGFPASYDNQYDAQQRHLMDPNDGHHMPLIPGVHLNQRQSMHPMLHMQHAGTDYSMYNPHGAYMSYQYPDPPQHQQHYQQDTFGQGNLGVYMPMHPSGQHSPEQEDPHGS